MTRTVLMTGAGGNIGSKLRAHFSTLEWTLRLLDVDARGDAEIQAVDLAEWNDAWVAQFVDVDTVIISPATRARGRAGTRRNG